MSRKARGKRKKVYKKTPGGEKKIYFEKGREKKKYHCIVCSGELAGVSDKQTLSKSKKKPNALFAGILCTKCRANAMEEAIKIKEGLKELKECDQIMKKYIEHSLKILE